MMFQDYLKKDCKGFSKESLENLVMDALTQNRIQKVSLKELLHESV